MSEKKLILNVAILRVEEPSEATSIADLPQGSVSITILLRTKLVGKVLPL